jgi:hypothetical protein
MHKDPCLDIGAFKFITIISFPSVLLRATDKKNNIRSFYTLVSKIRIEICDVPSDMDRLLFLITAGTKIEVSRLIKILVTHLWFPFNINNSIA